jgi:ribosomal-protein-alanine N-acetyltransferase
MDNLKLYLAVNNTMETKRLKLRPVNLTDTEDMHEYASDDENTYFVFQPHQTLDDTRFAIATYFMAEPLGKFGIELKEEKKLIGTADLRVNMTKSKAELGYALNKEYFNQGFATEAAEALIKFAFETLELEKVTASCDERNKASEAVMKKLGMQLEGRSRQHELWKSGEWVNMLFYGILREEYNEMKKSI